MRKRHKLILTAAVVLIDCALFSACGGNYSAYSTFAHFGSETVWAFPQGGEHGEIWKEINGLAEEIENSLSSAGGGAVFRFNEAEAGEKVELSEREFAIFSFAKRIYEETDGAYNPAVGNLIDLWGLSPRCSAADYAPALPYDRDYLRELPAEEYIDAFSSLCDFSKVQLLSGEKFYAVKPACVQEIDGTTYSMKLDFGGFGKGYCADEAKKLIPGGGKGYLNFGGSSLVLFENPAASDGFFDLGVLDPRGGGTFMSVKTKNVCVSTSGDYMNCYEIGGTRYCHIVDSASGYPVSAGEGEKICAATVLSDSAAEGDALSTALMVMGKERALSFAKERSLNVILFISDGEKETLYTDLSPEKYTLYREIEVVQI